MDSQLNIVCLESDALYELIDTVVEHLLEKHSIDKRKWILGEDVMAMLGIKSVTTLAKLRNEGKIRFSQPSPKIIVYDRESILVFLDNNAKETF